MLRDDGQQHALGQRAGGVAGPRQRAGRGALDVGEVVAALAHRGAERRVGGARLLRGRGGLGALRAQFGGEADEVLEHLGRHPSADPQLRRSSGVEVSVERAARALEAGNQFVSHIAELLAPASSAPIRDDGAKL